VFSFAVFASFAVRRLGVWRGSCSFDTENRSGTGSGGSAVNLVEVDEATRRLVLVNDTCHLTGAGTDLVPKDVLTDAGDPADIAP